MINVIEFINEYFNVIVVAFLVMFITLRCVTINRIGDVYDRLGDIDTRLYDVSATLNKIHLNDLTFIETKEDKALEILETIDYNNELKDIKERIIGVSNGEHLINLRLGELLKSAESSEANLHGIDQYTYKISAEAAQIRRDVNKIKKEKKNESH